MKIKKRAINFIFLGMLSLFIIETVYGWSAAVKDIKRGYIHGCNAAKK